MSTKVCSKCNKELPLTEFYKNKSGKFGLAGRCKACDKIRFAVSYRTDKCKDRINRWVEKQQVERLYKHTKFCDKCKRELPLSDFYNKTKAKLGVEVFCKECKGKDNDNYRKSENGKVVLKRFYQSDKRKDAVKVYRKSEKGKATLKKQSQSDKWKATKSRSRHKRRTQKRILSTLTAQEWNDIKDKYEYKCIYCGEKKKLTMEHIIPLSKGGYHVKENVVPACRSCNSKRGIKPTLLQLLVPDTAYNHNI